MTPLRQLQQKFTDEKQSKQYFEILKCCSILYCLHKDAKLMIFCDIMLNYLVQEIKKALYAYHSLSGSK